MKLKVDDKVLVTAGKDKGREGKILKVYPDKESVVVEGLNMYKRHRKAMMGQPGGIIDKPRPYNLAKVALICPKCKKPTRVGYKIDNQDNVKERICKKCMKKIN